MVVVDPLGVLFIDSSANIYKIDWELANLPMNRVSQGTKILEPNTCEVTQCRAFTACTWPYTRSSPPGEFNRCLATARWAFATEVRYVVLSFFFKQGMSSYLFTALLFNMLRGILELELEIFEIMRIYGNGNHEKYI